MPTGIDQVLNDLRNGRAASMNTGAEVYRRRLSEIQNVGPAIQIIGAIVANIQANGGYADVDIGLGASFEASIANMIGVAGDVSLTAA